MSFENEGDRKVDTGYYFPKVGIKDYIVIIDGENLFDQPLKSDMRTYNNIQKFETGQGDDYTTGCLLDYDYFKEHYKTIAIDISKQQALGTEPKAIEQINFTANLDRQGNTTIFLLLKKRKKPF